MRTCVFEGRTRARAGGLTCRAHLRERHVEQQRESTRPAATTAPGAEAAQREMAHLGSPSDAECGANAMPSVPFRCACSSQGRHMCRLNSKLRATTERHAECHQH
ncbi:unnamed protein product [Symbiodinium natans]|uniref:Uncharacterized protein n=1 Tax=Symbiodinium natans TaxID=878477 RepID=A0A812NFV8_9DINO|nr:unnamed protein product [Symbiodinium natans]